MEWIKIILPLLGVLVGWFLSERGKKTADSRQDKRKLKQLLFFLLDLRYHFAKEHSKELEMDRFVNKLKSKLVDKFDIDNQEQILSSENFKSILDPFLNKISSTEENFEYLSKNIDRILFELAEVFPLLAYELNGQHNIKERLNKANDYFGEMEKIVGDMPLEIKNWINPKITKGLLSGLDESIENITNK